MRAAGLGPIDRCHGPPTPPSLPRPPARRRIRVACGCGGERPASHAAHATSAAAVESAADSAKERRPLRFRFRAPGASISIHLAVVESVCGLGAGGNEDLAWVYLDDRIGAQQLQGQQPYVDLACSTRLQLPQRTWAIEVVVQSILYRLSPSPMMVQVVVAQAPGRTLPSYCTVAKTTPYSSSQIHDSRALNK